METQHFLLLKRTLWDISVFVLGCLWLCLLSLLFSYTFISYHSAYLTFFPALSENPSTCRRFCYLYRKSLNWCWYDNLLVLILLNKCFVVWKLQHLILSASFKILETKIVNQERVHANWSCWTALRLSLMNWVHHWVLASDFHPSNFYSLSGFGSRDQKFKLRCQDLPLLDHLI